MCSPVSLGRSAPMNVLRFPTSKQDFEAHLARAKTDKGFGLHPEADKAEVPVKIGNETFTLTHGSLLIAAITSCTNTSNPTVMLSAGVVAKRALERGLTVSPVVKCSLMPGSQVVTAYLQKAGLFDSLDNWIHPGRLWLRQLYWQFWSAAHPGHPSRARFQPGDNQHLLR